MSKKIKENIIVDKKDFLDKYKRFYANLSSKILKRIKNGSEQKLSNKSKQDINQNQS